MKIYWLGRYSLRKIESMNAEEAEAVWQAAQQYALQHRASLIAGIVSVALLLTGVFFIGADTLMSKLCFSLAILPISFTRAVLVHHHIRHQLTCC